MIKEQDAIETLKILKENIDTHYLNYIFHQAPEISQAIKIILNLLEEKDTEIEKNKRLFSIQEKRKLHLLQKKDRVIEKKEKIIDLMADYIYNYVDIEDYLMPLLNSVKKERKDAKEERECIKQYFERKCLDVKDKR